MAGPAFEGSGRAREVARDVAVGGLASAVVLWVLVRGSAEMPFRLMALVVGVAILRWTYTHRATALAALFVVVPLQQTVLAWLYAHGAPAAAVRSAGFYKEAVIIGLVLAVVLDDEARRVKTGAADRAAVAFIALATFYLVLPAFIPNAFGAQPSDVRFSAWRLNVLFLVLFLACRRLRWTPAEIRKLENALLLVGGVLAIGGLWEMFDEAGYDDFLTNNAEQPRFVLEVLNGVVNTLDSVVVVSDVGGEGATRVGGWLLNPLTMGFVLIVPIAIGMRRLATGGRTLPVLLVTAGSIVVLCATLTRSAILGGFVATAVVVWLVVKGNQRQALALVLGLIVAAVCVLPFMPGTTLAERITGATNGTDVSTDQHSERSSNAFDLSLRTPLGLGLGSNPGTGTLFDTSNHETAEDAYLQISLELGWAALVLFAVTNLALLRDSLAQSWRSPSSSSVAVAGALLGLAVGGFFLHVWLDFQTSLLFWGFAGVATSRIATPWEPVDDEGSTLVPVAAMT